MESFPPGSDRKPLRRLGGGIGDGGDSGCGGLIEDGVTRSNTRVPSRLSNTHPRPSLSLTYIVSSPKRAIRSDAINACTKFCEFQSSRAPKVGTVVNHTHDFWEK